MADDKVVHVSHHVHTRLKKLQLDKERERSRRCELAVWRLQ